MKFDIYDFTSFTTWIHDSLSASFSPGVVQLIEFIIVGVAFALFFIFPAKIGTHESGQMGISPDGC